MDNINSIINKFSAIERQAMNSFNDDHELGIHHSALILLLDGMIEKFKSIEVLFKNKQIEGISILERSILESSVSIDYILSGSHKLARQRGRAFFFKNKLNGVNAAKNLIELGPFGINGKEMEAALTENIKQSNNNNYKNIDEYASYFEKKYKECFQLEGKTPKKQKRQLAKWYNQDGKINSVYDLFCKVDREDDYKVHYVLESEDVHASGVIGRALIQKNEFAIAYKINKHDVESQCVLWITKAEVAIVDYLSLNRSSRESISLQMDLLKNNWENVINQQKNEGNE